MGAMVVQAATEAGLATTLVLLVKQEDALVELVALQGRISARQTVVILAAQMEVSDKQGPAEQLEPTVLQLLQGR